MSKAKAVFLILAALLIGYFMVLRLFMPGFLQQMLPFVETTAAEYVNGKINIGSLRVSDSLKITADDVAVFDTKGELLASSPSVNVSVNVWKGILQADPIKAVDMITVNRPVFHLQMDEKEHWNVKDVIKQRGPEKSRFAGMVRIVDGKSEVATPFGKWSFGVDGSIDAAADPNYELNIALAYGGETWKITGLVNTKAKGSLLLQTEQFALEPFDVLAKRYLNIEGLKGSVKDLHLRWSGDGRDIALEGTGFLANVAASAVYQEEKILLTLNGKVAFQQKVVEAVDLDFTVNGEKGRLNGKLDLSNFDEPLAEELSLELNAFDLQKAWTSSPVGGKIAGSVVLNGTQSAFDAQGVFNADKIVYDGQIFSKVRLPLAAKNSRIVIPGAKAEYGGGGIFMFGEYELNEGDFSAALEFDNANIAGLAGFAGESALLSGDVALTGKMKGEQGRINAVAKMAVLNWRNNIFRDFRLDIDYDKKNIIINNLSSYCNDDGSLVAQGSITGGNIAAEARIANLPLQPLLAVAGQEGSGKLTGSFVLSGSAASPQVSGTARLTDSEIMKQKITDAQGSFSWLNKRLQIDRLHISMPAGEHTINGWVDLGGEEPVVNLSVLTKGIRVEPLMAVIAPDVALTGNLNNEVTVQGAISNPAVIGKMNFYEGSFNKYLLDDAIGEYSVTDGILHLKDFVIHALQTEINLDGTVDKNKNLDFVMNASKLDLKKLAIPDKVKVSGLVDLNGKLQGTLDTPFFTGGLNSRSIVINGQEFTDITGSLESTAGKVNKLKGSARQGGGLYGIDMLIDFTKVLLQGSIEVKGGNMQSLLALAGQDYDIAGELDGSIIVNKGGKGTGTSISGQIRNCSIRGIRYPSAVFDVFIHKDVLNILKARIDEELGGFFAAQGTVDFRSGKLALDAFCSEADASVLNAFIKAPVDFGGKMSLAAQVSGTIDNPTANASVTISQGQIADTPFDNLYGMFTLRDDLYNIEQLYIQKDIYKASAYGVLPHDLFRAKEDRKNSDAQMAIKVKLDNADLAILPMLSDKVESGSGETNGALVLTGTLEEPLVDGTFDITNGTIKLKQMSTLIENLKMAVKFEGRMLRLQEMSAKIGPRGRLNAEGTFGLPNGESAPYQLNVKADNVEIASNIFSGIINGKAAVTQKRSRPHIESEIRLDKVLVNMPTLPELKSGSSNIGLDIKIELGPEIHLYNKYLYDLWLAGGLHIMGSTRYTNVDGSLTATKGTVSYLRTPFKIRRATAGFPIPGSLIPTINLDSAAKFGRYNVNMQIDGPLDQMELKLSSDPPLSQQELFRMLTLKSYSNGNSASGNGLESHDLQALLDVGIEMTFLRDVETIFKEELNLDQFRVYSGNTATGIGFEINAKNAREFTQEEKEQYNVLASKYIADNILVGYATSLDGQYHNVFAQYEVNKNITFNLSVNEEQKKWYGLEYHLSF
ncbi:MAG: translocation/assembly module TamB domain-containing protein [Acidaminococcaceae bacterium]